jgi:hypothetical protein
MMAGTWSRPVAADDFYDEAPVVTAGLGPIFTATYETECESCEEGIQPGEDARADGHGGWIHADTMCEKVARDG